MIVALGFASLPAADDAAKRRQQAQEFHLRAQERTGRYFAANAADVIVVHEGNAWPKEERLKGDYFGGYSDYPPFTRGVLLHSQERLDRPSLQKARKYSRWVYVTEAVYQADDPKLLNPWSRLSKHLEETCEALSQK